MATVLKLIYQGAEIYSLPPSTKVLHANGDFNVIQSCLYSGCGSVGRAVAADTRGLRFEPSHWQMFIYIEHLFTANCVLKRRKRRKRSRDGPFF